MRPAIYFLLLPVLATSCTSRTSDDEPLYQLDPLPTTHIENRSTSSSSKVAHIFYLVQKNQIKDAIDILLEAKKEDPYLFHSGILDRLGLSILQQGLNSKDPQDRFTSLFGIGIAQDERAIDLVHKALIARDDPQEELIALSVLTRFDSEHADTLLEAAMKSNYIFVRLEAAYILAQKKSPKAYGQIEALMHKIDPEFRPLFPKLFAIEGGIHSSEMLKKLLFDHDVRVRLEAIHAVTECARDDYLEEIRRLALDPDPIQQEATASALGHFKDEASIPLLQSIASKNNSSALAAHYALYQLGQDGAKEAIIEQAEKANPFALQLLAKIPDTDARLIEFQKSGDISCRINAALALLEKRNPACLAGIKDILIDTHQDYTFQPIYSLGGAFMACRVVTSSSQNLRKNPSFFELSLRFRESVLTAAMELPERDFLYIARLILYTNQRDLIPLCTRLLENLKTPDAISLLKDEEQQLGGPFVRAFCRLALFRLNEPGPYSARIKTFLQKHEDEAVFQARPVLPWRMRQENSPHDVTLEETARLVLESYQAFAEKQSEEGVELLLEAIRDGNEHNRFALSGLLMRSAM